MLTEKLLGMIDRAKPLVMRVVEMYDRIEEPEGHKKAISLEFILSCMPCEWRNQSVDSLVKTPFGAEMVQATFSAISELMVEGKLKFVPYFVTKEHIKVVAGTKSTSIGYWEFRIVLT